MLYKRKIYKERPTFREISATLQALMKSKNISMCCDVETFYFSNNK
jgi:hypothetical protein